MIDIRHPHVSAVPDNGNPNLVQGPHWNQAHPLLQAPAALLGRPDAAPGQAPTVEVPLDPATMAFIAGQLSCIVPNPVGVFVPLAGGTMTGPLVIEADNPGPDFVTPQINIVGDQPSIYFLNPVADPANPAYGGGLSFSDGPDPATATWAGSVGWLCLDGVNKMYGVIGPWGWLTFDSTDQALTVQATEHRFRNRDNSGGGAATFGAITITGDNPAPNTTPQLDLVGRLPTVYMHSTVSDPADPDYGFYFAGYAPDGTTVMEMYFGAGGVISAQVSGLTLREDGKILANCGVGDLGTEGFYSCYGNSPDHLMPITGSKIVAESDNGAAAGYATPQITLKGIYPVTMLQSTTNDPTDTDNYGGGFMFADGPDITGPDYRGQFGWFADSTGGYLAIEHGPRGGIGGAFYILHDGTVQMVGISAVFMVKGAPAGTYMPVTFKTADPADNSAHGATTAWVRSHSLALEARIADLEARVAALSP